MSQPYPETLWVRPMRRDKFQRMVIWLVAGFLIAQLAALAWLDFL